MRNKFSACWLTIFFLTSFFSASLAQHPDFANGKLFVKVFNDWENELPEFDGASSRSVLAAYPALANIAEAYSVARLQKAFRTRSEDLDRIYEIQFSAEQSPESLIRELERLPFVEYAEKIPVYAISFTPNDYDAVTLYHLEVIRATQAWDITTGSNQVVIAVVDNAVLTTHTDLASNIWVNPGEIAGNGIDDDNNGFIDDINGWDAADHDNDPNPPNGNFDHGTHVAGCATASTNNSTGVAAIGFNCRIMAVKTKLDATTGPTLDATFQGVDYAIAAGADIVNMSFGGSGFSAAWQSLLNAGHAQGVIFVAASGNTGNHEAQYPAAFNHVISVGATNASDVKAGFSTYDETVDVMAPGVWIRSTIPSFGLGSTYASFSGTSMSSPIVAGILGLMKSVEPSLTPNVAEACLKSTCEDIYGNNSPAYAGLMGAGRVDAFMAVNCLVNPVMPVAAFSLSNTTECGGTFQLSDQSQNIPTSWNWDFGSGLTSTDQHPVVSFPASGSYPVTLIVSNAAGTDTISQMLTVTVLDVPQVDAGPDLSLCYGEQVQLNASSSLAGSVSWSPSAGLSGSSVLDPLMTATASRTYFVTVVSSEGCAGMDTLEVEVFPTPTIYAGADRTINAGDDTQMNAIGGITYEWSPATGLSDPFVGDPVASPVVSTLYTVTGFNAAGCPDTDEVWVYVTGVTSIDPADFGSQGSLFPPSPNPSNGTLHLAAEFMQGGSLSIRFSDLSGRILEKVWTGTLPSGSFSLDWTPENQPAAGFYFIIWEMNGLRRVQKIQRF
jgi:subtilisin family serine protease